jgi:hypothetical protein
MSTIVIGSFIMFSSNVCLATELVPSVLPSCSITLGTVTRINGQQLLVTPEQGNTPIQAKYSDTTHIIEKEVVGSSALRRGIDVKVLATAANNQARVVVLNPSNDTRQSSLLGCQIPQTTQHPAATPSSSRSSDEPIPSQGIIEQVTNNAFTISPRTSQPKTFTWSTETPFIQYTDYQPAKMLSSGAPVLLIGPMRNGVIMASLIAVLPQGQMKASFKRATGDCTDLGFFYSCSGPDNCTDLGLSYTCAGPDNCTDLGLSYTCAGPDNCTDLGLSYTCAGPDNCTDLGLFLYTCSGDDQDAPDM